MTAKALFVGGCPHRFHFLEPAIEPIRTALAEIGLESDFAGILHPDGGADYTGDYSALNADNLSRYALLVLYTTGNNPFGGDVQAILDFVERGGALVGIHNAADSFTDNPAFVHLIGGKFRTHPAQLAIKTEIVDSEHSIMAGVSEFTVWDELYLFADYDPTNVHLLAETNSYEPEPHTPIAWTREQGAGRVFYVSLGHNPATLEDASWRRLFQNGTEWALRTR